MLVEEILDERLLLITHRAKSLELADEVIVLKDGTVVRAGNIPGFKKQQEQRHVRVDARFALAI
jgi:ABC-type multidrug transport system fused ATPase/permease subunit